MDNRPKFNHQRFLKNLMEKAQQPPPRLQTAGVYYIIEAFLMVILTPLKSILKVLHYKTFKTVLKSLIHYPQ